MNLHPLLFIALLVQAAASRHLRRPNRIGMHYFPADSPSSEEETPSLDTSAGTSESSSLKRSHSRKHGHHGGGNHSARSQLLSQGSRSGKKGSLKGKRGHHHHWELELADE
jgi:hypothetical protein